ncbi:hypothetical protein P691DRAFT_325217 [Macrolepiota fuliginosa MF-IS2]|uniref:Brain protein I3 n=1 Tax=Macrolepiota fuliginosa MF-IS2 TaxID=1400762 RepID=A0A9P5X6N7_9AGAR|nr:hypothetical protein P691DRAFT_325217 [Macrolepiota fuliginosa MF-IS2]
MTLTSAALTKQAEALEATAASARTPALVPPPAYAPLGNAVNAGGVGPSQERIEMGAVPSAPSVPPAAAQQQTRSAHAAEQSAPHVGGGGSGDNVKIVKVVVQDTGVRECREDEHSFTTNRGTCGIVCAIVCFPIGLIGLCIDKEEVCVRCGYRQ